MAIAVVLLAVSPTVGAALTGDAAASRSQCSSRQIGAALGDFVNSFNRGEFERLDGLFAEQPAFEWFSSDRPGRRVGRVARNRDTLVRYFERRHAAHDRLGLGFFRFNGNSPRWGNFEARVRRSAADYRGGQPFRTSAKGAAVCAASSVSFIVMSFGGPQPR